MLQDLNRAPQLVAADPAYRSAQKDCPGVDIIHRARFEDLSKEQKAFLKRRSAIEPAIGHTKADHGMVRCWLKGALGDAVHAIACAAGHNIKWLLRAIVPSCVWAWGRFFYVCCRLRARCVLA